MRKSNISGFFVMACALSLVCMSCGKMEDEQLQAPPITVVKPSGGIEGAIMTFNEYMDFYLKEEEKKGRTRAGSNRPTVSNVQHVNSVAYGEPFSATRSTDNGLSVYELALENDDATEGFALVLESSNRQDVIAYSPVGAIADTTYNEALAGWFHELYAFGRMATDKTTETRGDVWQMGWQYAYSPISDWEFDRLWTEADKNKGEEYWGAQDWSENVHLQRTNPRHEWNQTAPYNNKVPVFRTANPRERVKVGCWAVAVGMLMAIHQHPPVGYNWALLNSTKTVQPLETAKADEVSRLLYDIAQKGQTTFDAVNNHGNTEPSNIKFGLLRLGYSSEKVYYGSSNSTMDAIEEIRNNRPVLYVGYGSDGGHMWLVDEVQIRQTWRYKLVRSNNSPTVLSWHKMRCQSNLMRCNWGWGGHSNGYYHSFEPYYVYYNKYIWLGSETNLIKGIKPSNIIDL